MSRRLPDTIQSKELLVDDPLGFERRVLVDQDLKHVAEMLARSQGPKVARLDSCNLGDDGVIFVAQALKVNTILETLSLGNNDIGDNGAFMLAEVLQTHTSLKELFLDANYVGDCGTIALVHGLKENKTLELLNLECNHIGTVGALALARVIKENKVLKTLELASNRIGNDGIIAISAALKWNTSLLHLDVSNNGFDDEAETTLVEALKFNCCLRAFDGINLLQYFPFLQSNGNFTHLTDTNASPYSYSHSNSIILSYLGTLPKSINWINLVCYIAAKHHPLASSLRDLAPQIAQYSVLCDLSYPACIGMTNQQFLTTGTALLLNKMHNAR